MKGRTQKGQGCMMHVWLYGVNLSFVTLVHSLVAFVRNR